LIHQQIPLNLLFVLAAGGRLSRMAMADSSTGTILREPAGVLLCLALTVLAR
jgi:hypothetical protein